MRCSVLRLVLVVPALTACTATGPDQEIPLSSSAVDTTSALIAAASSTFLVEQHGAGKPLLLVHGGGEDARMRAGQAKALAAAGYRVITDDRRGTGGSGRDAWPGNGAEQHADDAAAALLDPLDATPATVLGLSSGDVVALAIAARHPQLVERAVAWEPPAAGVLPDAAGATAAVMAPVEAHLQGHPGDYVGAQAILLTEILGSPQPLTIPHSLPPASMPNR